MYRGFSIDLTLKNSEGKTLFGQEDFLDWNIDVRKLIHDLFANITLDLSGAPAGTYKVEFIVRDVNSEKMATVAQNIKMK